MGAGVFNLRFLISLLAALCLNLAATSPVISQDRQANMPSRPRTALPNNAGKNNQSPADSSASEVGEGDVLRIDTQLVTVPAVVTDRHGRPITGLQAENFALFEDSKPQLITNFATTDAPFEIALLLDTSGSTRTELGLIRSAAAQFINVLRPDRKSVV